MKTYMASPEKVERKWFVVDAEGKTLGRLSSELAKILRGKINRSIRLMKIPVTILSLSMQKKSESQARKWIRRFTTVIPVMSEE